MGGSASHLLEGRCQSAFDRGSGSFCVLGLSGSGVVVTPVVKVCRLTPDLEVMVKAGGGGDMEEEIEEEEENLGVWDRLKLIFSTKSKYSFKLTMKK